MNRVLILGLALVLASCGGGADKGNESAATAVQAPTGTNWTETFSQSPDNGMIMGNPAAAVKLVEYGALSCPACRQFAEASKVELKKYVAKGTVSFEFRTFLIHPQDLPASLLARCNGPAAFFGLSEQMYANFDGWMGEMMKISEADQKAWSTMQPGQMAADMANKGGLIAFFQQRGISAEKANACLADPNGIKQLEAIMKKAADDKVAGTPTFFINGVKSDAGADWKALENELRNAGA